MVRKTELERLIGIVEGKLAELPKLAPTGKDTDWQQRRIEVSEYHQAADRALAALKEHGGKVREFGGSTSLRLGGFSASCTDSAAGVMHNWISGAKRRLAALEVA